MTRRFLVVYTLAWTACAVVYAVVIALRRDTPLDSAAYSAGINVGAAAVLGLVAWWATRRLAWDGRRRVRFWLLQAAVATGYGAAWAAFIAMTLRLFAPPVAYSSYVRYALGWQVVIGVCVYGLLAGISYAQQALQQLRAQEALAARAEALRVDAELRALRAQLNPHFLFNTLHSITALVRRDPLAAEAALERLGGLLRHVLSLDRESRDEVSLAEEWAFARTYLALEQIRLGARLRVAERIDADALDCAVPSFTLQPLVENAVRHAIAPRARGGTIAVTICFETEALRIDVADDGPGAVPAPSLGTGGLGLRAVRQRLAARHPGRSSVEVVTAPGDGFRVTVRLPIVPAPAPAPGVPGPALPAAEPAQVTP